MIKPHFLQTKSLELGNKTGHKWSIRLWASCADPDIFTEGEIILFSTGKGSNAYFLYFTVFNIWIFQWGQDPLWPAPPPPPPSTFCINNVKYQPSAPSYPPPHPHKKNKTPKSKTTTYQINIDAIQGQRLMKHFLNIYLYLIDKETTRSNLEWMITMITSQTSI